MAKETETEKEELEELYRTLVKERSGLTKEELIEAYRYVVALKNARS